MELEGFADNRPLAFRVLRCGEYPFDCHRGVASHRPGSRVALLGAYRPSLIGFVIGVESLAEEIMRAGHNGTLLIFVAIAVMAVSFAVRHFRAKK